MCVFRCCAKYFIKGIVGEYGNCIPIYSHIVGEYLEYSHLKGIVLCHGDSCTLTLSLSTLSREVRQRVSHPLLHQTLQEQGIEGRNATLSCTLVPTDLYAAWCYVQGMQASEEHFALEGLTQMQVRRFGEHVYHLARSLKNISFDNVFTTSLSPYRVTLPNNLQSLTFGNDFNQSLDRETLPSNLQSLTFSNHFNQSLDRVTLPNKLQSLTFGSDVNQSLNGVALPNSLHSLTFGVRFNQSLDRVTLSSSLKSLTLGYDFNQSLNRVTLPRNLQSLTFSNHFNQSLDRVTLPNNLQSL